MSPAEAGVIILLVDMMAMATLPVYTFVVQKDGHSSRVVGQMLRPGLVLLSFNWLSNW